jgi:hypothetical protein
MPDQRWAGPSHDFPLATDLSGIGYRESGIGSRVSGIARCTITSVDPLRTGARLLSKGMRGGNGALTLLGALLAARGIVRWLDRPDRELLYSKRLKPGQSLEIRVPTRD